MPRYGRYGKPIYGYDRKYEGKGMYGDGGQGGGSQSEGSQGGGSLRGGQGGQPPKKPPPPKPWTEPMPPAMIQCDDCNGHGKIYHQCSDCRGSCNMPCPDCSDSRRRRLANRLDTLACRRCAGAMTVQCGPCGGRGNIPRDCKKCKGTGEVKALYLF